MTPSSESAAAAPKTGTMAALALWAVLVGSAVVAVAPLYPPRVVPATAPASEFSAERAMAHVEAIARRPRPVGSPEHARVRRYIVDELTALGLSPGIQSTMGARTTRRVLLTAPVHNIVTRMRGAGDGRAVLLVAHYDTVAASPGASDNANSVAALLETLRALRHAPPLENDLIVLFTDGEEVGLLGAQAFVDQHPWAREVGLVLNFEARGTHGAAALFQTSASNGRLIREFLAAAPHPVLNSFLSGLYGHLPFDTDLTVFLDAGFTGLNMGYVAGLAPYHTALDDLRRIDPRSLQHQGSYALALTKRFGNLDLSEMHGRDRVFFNLLGPIVVSYPDSAGTGLTAVAVLAFAGVVGLGLRRKALSLKGLLRGFSALVLCVTGTAGIVTAMWWLIARLHPGYRFFVQGDPYNSGLYIGAFLSLGVAITIRIHAWMSRKVSVQDLLAGGLSGWLICAVTTTFALPAGSYLFAWPLVFGLACLGVLVSLRGDGTLSRLGLVILTVGAVPPVLLLVPMVYLLFILTALNAPAVVVVPAVLLTALLIPQLHLLPATIRRPMPAAGVLICIGLLVAGSATSGVDAAHPKQDSIAYSLNVDTGKAAWFSLDPGPDEWTSQFLSKDVRRGSLREQIPWVNHEALQCAAPVAPLKPPELEIVGDSVEDDGTRNFKLRVRSARSASVLVAWVNAAITITEVDVGGKRIDYRDRSTGGPGAPRLVVCSVPPEQGFELDVESAPAEPARLTVTDATVGLPSLRGAPFRPRPPYLISKPVPGLTDSTVVSRTFVLRSDRAPR